MQADAKHLIKMIQGNMDGRDFEKSTEPLSASDNSTSDELSLCSKRRLLAAFNLSANN